MIIDATCFGYGAGLVMLGWFCGMVFKTIMTSIGGVR